VIGIKGSDGMALQTVGVLGDVTGGTVNMSHPLELLTQIVRISQRPVVASNVRLRGFCPPGYAWNALKKPVQVIEDEIGNATIETDITYEFGYLGDSNESKKSKRRVPFQVQIRYTRADNYKCLRVISELRPVLVSREEVIKYVDVAILGLNAVQQCGQMAIQNAKDASAAREKLFFCHKFLQKCLKESTKQEEYANFMKFARPLDINLMSLAQNKFKNAEEEDSAAKLFYQMKVISKNEFFTGSRKTEVVLRRAQCNDQLTDMFYEYRF